MSSLDIKMYKKEEKEDYFENVVKNNSEYLKD